MTKKCHEMINLASLFFPFKNPRLKDQAGVDLRLVSHWLGWCPAINPYSAANSSCQKLPFCTMGTQALAWLQLHTAFW